MNSIWKPEYENGVAAIDEQHRRLAERLAQLEETLTQQKPRQEVGALLTELIAETQSHFREEEALMEQHNYAQVELHRREHVDLLQRVLAYKARFDGGASDLTPSVMRFLQSWLSNHILGADRRFITAVKPMGGQPLQSGAPFVH